MFLAKIINAKYIKYVVILSLVYMTCWGAMSVFAPIRPFRADEWRIIYNIKFKSYSQIWGPLQFTQQFPRVYLYFLKVFASCFDYNYFILRFPSFLMGVATILLGYRLVPKIAKRDAVTEYLFILLIVSSFTFTEYFVQMKQYTMEIFLSLVAIWQLLNLLKIESGQMPSGGRYSLLCFSFLAAPFFSYTYPIAVSPVFVLMFIRGLRLLKNEVVMRQKAYLLFLLWFPLLLAAVSIIIFYAVDVSGVLRDKEMYGYWNYRTISGPLSVMAMAGKIWDFFAQAGSGLLFEIIMGVLGICATINSAFCLGYAKNKNKSDANDVLRSYSLLLIATTIALFMSGKLPVEPRFNLFSLPSLAILIIFFLNDLLELRATRNFAMVNIMVIYLGLIGNIFTSSINSVLLPKYKKSIKIFTTTQKAIFLAQKNNLPIIVTAEVAYPDKIMDTVPHLTRIAPAAVLKAFPAYKPSSNLLVYSAPSINEIESAIEQLPPAVQSVLVLDGPSYRVVNLTSH